jgi:DNA-binding transcriptional ArsR family regulator
MTLSPINTAILKDLRESYESTVTEDDGSRWGSVYLDNARVEGMSPRSFAGHLSALEKAGLYKSQDDNFFGLVRLED